MLVTQQLSKHFNQISAVDRLDLKVNLGQIRGLLGPNGAGKSTAIKMICGVLAPSSGTVKIDGIDLSKKPSDAKRILGYVPEGAPLPPELLPVEYLNYVASVYGINGTHRKSVISNWAERCDISNVMRQTIGTLSRGYQQRVSLSAALLHNPKLLVLDEPSTGLDPEQSSLFRNLLKEVSDTTAIIYSSHHLAEVEATCDVVSIINEGKLLFDDELKNLSKPNTEYVVEFSPHSIAETIGGENVQRIDEDWVRCNVSSDKVEILSKIITKSDGRLRLLQPESHSLELAYLDIIKNQSTFISNQL